VGRGGIVEKGVANFWSLTHIMTTLSQMHISFSVFCVEVLIIRYDKMVSHMMLTCAFVFIIKARDPGKDLPY
jgi:hypothetical protein